MERNDLKPEYLFAEQAASYLQTNPRKIALLRKMGLIRSGRLGKRYVYKKEWLDDFMNSWAGYDLSGESKIRQSIREKEWKEKHLRGSKQ